MFDLMFICASLSAKKKKVKIIFYTSKASQQIKTNIKYYYNSNLKFKNPQKSYQIKILA